MAAYPRLEGGQGWGEGLIVRMSREEGLTAEDVLPYPFYFQMPPLDEFTIEGSHAWTDFDTLRLGQRSRPGGPQLRTLRFNTLFVDWSPTEAVWPKGNVPNALALRDTLFEIMDAGTPFSLFVHMLGHRPESSEVHMLATLRSLRATERAGEPDARYVDVEFTEYERLRLRRNVRRDRGERTRRHRLAKNDTLRGIALQYYGLNAWRLVADANGIRGVSSDNASELAAWARKRNRRYVTVPGRRAR